MLFRSVAYGSHAAVNVPLPCDPDANPVIVVCVVHTCATRNRVTVEKSVRSEDRTEGRSKEVAYIIFDLQL